MSIQRQDTPRTCFRLTGEIGDVRRAITLVDGDNRVGSLAECEVCIPEADVSRRHAVLRVSPRGVEVDDLDSTNGTFVNGVRVNRSMLKEGDWLLFGSILFSLEVVPKDDTALAFSLTPEPTIEGRADRRTEMAIKESIHDGWFEVFREACERVLITTPPDLGAALHAVASALGADSAALLEATSDGNATVAGLWGQADAIRGLEDGHVLEKLAESMAGDRGTARIDGREPLMASILRNATGWSVALVVSCSGSGPEAAPILELMLLVLATTVHGHGTEPTAAPQTTAELKLPAGHVEGHSGASKKMYEALRLALTDDAPVLITGETGAGKEHAVQILHTSSPRFRGPLEAINCAALPADLLEAELFGIESGVATGVSGRRGKLIAADAGTVFFDEVGEMSGPLQAKLLRALEKGEVHPVGARQPIAINVRMVAATNVNLKSRIREGGFRADLYYRLAGHRIEVPSLHQRRKDIPELVRVLVDRFAQEAGKRIRGVSIRAMRHLQAATWPGNVRELGNELRRLVAVCPEGGAIESSMIPPEILGDTEPTFSELQPTPQDLDLKRQVEILERSLLTRALIVADGNVSHAARKLGITRNGLVMKMQRLGISRD